MPVPFSRVESGWPEHPLIASAMTIANPHAIVFVVDVLIVGFLLGPYLIGNHQRFRHFSPQFIRREKRPLNLRTF
jgi:hypothetical protein